MSQLGEARWPELGTDLLLAVPMGSCEQHGPHLPLDTDTLLARSFAEDLGSRRDDVVVAPPVGIGASGEHQGFPGTLSIGTEALVATAVELARSALPPPGATAPRPFRAMLFVNGHGGNVEALDEAVRLLSAESRRVGAWHPRVAGGDPHAGATETSLMLHLHPDRVRTDLAEPGTADRFRDIRERIRTEGLPAITPNGVLGDPTSATATRGRELFRELADDLARSAAALLDDSPPPASPDGGVPAAD